MAQTVNVNFQSDADTKTDPFYSENNMTYLRRGIAALNAGKGVEHELIEIDDE